VFTVRFGSVFIKKSNQTEFFFKKKNQNRTETGSNRFGSVLARFGSVFSGLPRFWLGFFSLARFWLGLARFFFGSVFPVPGLKNRNRTGRFFQNFNRFNRFFFTVRFFRLFFFRFSRFNRFFDFFEHP